jgi:hypothetical protein
MTTFVLALVAPIALASTALPELNVHQSCIGAARGASASEKKLNIQQC